METAAVPLPESGHGSYSWTDTGTLSVLLITLFGFVMPMLFVYPPVAPRPSDFLSETHSQPGLDGGVAGKFRPEESEPGKGGNDGPTRLTDLWIYPVKSCCGIRLARSKVLPTGLEYDRLFAFGQLRGEMGGEGGSPDSPIWDILTQRQCPRLATLQVELWRPDLVKAQKAKARMRADDWAERASSTGLSYVVISFPWSQDGSGSNKWSLEAAWAWTAAKLARGWRAVPEVEVVLPIAEAETSTEGASTETKSPLARVRIWRDVVRAIDMSAELPPSLQHYLGLSHRLGVFRIDPAYQRQLFRCAPTKDEAGYQPVTAFQDAYPIHLLNRNSVEALDALVPKDASLQHLDERRIRPNVIVSGVPAYDEGSWKTVVFKSPKPASLPLEAKFHVSCRTARCTLPNVDPDTGDRHQREPGQTLRAHRLIDEGAPKSGCMGMQLTPLFAHPEQPELMELTLEVGMDLAVLERGEHRFV